MSEVRHIINDDFDAADFDPIEEHEDVSLNFAKDYLLHEEDEGDIDEQEVDRSEKFKLESVKLNGQVEKSGRKKRWINGKSSRLKNGYIEDKVIKLAINNANKMAILRCLYTHRQLDMFQIGRVATPHMHKKSVGNLLAEMYAQRLLNRENLLKASRAKGDEKKFHYRLAKLGLYIIATFDLQALWNYSHPNQPKQHYLLQNLAVGSQQAHHFETQEFMSRLIYNLTKKEIYFPHSDWKRYPIQDLRVAGKITPYRPDWFIFKPNHFYTELVKQKRVTECPLNIPVESRQEADREILNQHYAGFLSIECDLKTEDSKEIEDKCRKFIYSLDYYPQNNMAFFSVNGWYENDTLLPAPKNHTQMRARNTKKVIIRQMEEELVFDKTQVLHGDEYTCLASSEFFIENNGNMQQGYPRGNGFAKFVNETPSTLDKEILYFTDELKKIVLNPSLPIIPDEAVRIRNFGDAETHMIFFARLGWVNPIAKALRMQKWIDEGNQKAKIILIYPNKDELDNEVHFTDPPFFYVNWEDVCRTGVWGHYKKTVYRKIRNINTLTWEDANQ
ncbi:replication-relaxation family protein [Paenibacillus periandrae]|uniref:replication-relaxation family protein n=1 Tax=Paenibacillus periandrae TaxID=1761741 RepID=UPI001F08F0DA|nr:replication-relaxation family protein [Paenibacillus periandrae]